MRRISKLAGRGPRALEARPAVFAHLDPEPDSDDDDDWEAREVDPSRDEVWEPLELDDDEAFPQPGDFWPDLDGSED